MMVWALLKRCYPHMLHMYTHYHYFEVFMRYLQPFWVFICVPDSTSCSVDWAYKQSLGLTMPSFLQESRRRVTGYVPTRAMAGGGRGGDLPG